MPMYSVRLDNVMGRELISPVPEIAFSLGAAQYGLPSSCVSANPIFHFRPFKNEMGLSVPWNSRGGHSSDPLQGASFSSSLPYGTAPGCFGLIASARHSPSFSRPAAVSESAQRFRRRDSIGPEQDPVTLHYRCPEREPVLESSLQGRDSRLRKGQ
jgi:hypothetical protein